MQPRFWKLALLPSLTALKQKERREEERAKTEAEAEELSKVAK